ncbi:MAG: HD domain-containing protein [Calditrichaeota bacterium]|nr:MAG: HD domain-containing protein [Calditrichota bacterium]MBL1205166.1 HD domain-containing protein [Calditrichota bacterium]NOG44996.1 HD domain-containing protein [Calditrichota bacterium]
MLDRKEKLSRLIQLGLEVSQISDLDVLLEKILSEARSLVHADAGSIYIKEGEMLKFSYAQNDTLRSKLGPNKKLIYTTFSMPINNNSIAGFVANTGKTSNIPDAYKISPSLPFAFNSDFDKKVGYHTTSILTVPLKNTRKQIIGVLQLINAQDDADKIIAFMDEDEPLIIHFANYAANAIEKAQLTRTTIMRMISMAELRDPKETGPHVNRVAAYSLEIYEAYAHKKGISKEQISSQKDSLRMAAMLHDVGKVAISDNILKKPGRFTEEEYDVMKTHTILGAQLFGGARSEFDEIAEEVALNHHERWDGKGYPGYIDIDSGEGLAGHKDKDGNVLGKKEEEIPLFGRIVAIADVFDALSSKRVYKDAWTEEQVFEALREGSGSQFDPDLIEVFFENVDVMRSIQQRYPDEN